MSAELEVADHVTVGHGRVHWVIQRIHAGNHMIGATADLRSGQTGLWRADVPLSILTLHTKGMRAVA